jgi:thymidylate synthase ThyX
MKEWNSKMLEIQAFCDEVNAWITTAPSAEMLDECDQYLRQLSAYYSRYTVISGLQLGVAKEQARTILPLNLETTFIWTGSLLAYINFWKLRITRDTQIETMQIAMEMLCELKLRSNCFQYSLKAFHI